MALFRIKNDIKTLWVDTSKGGQLEAEVECSHPGKTLEYIGEAYSAGVGSSNTILVDGLWGFFETTIRDQSDGGISGSVRRSLRQSEKDYWEGQGLTVTEKMTLKAGSFKIAGSGKVVRFAGLPVKKINKELGYA